MRALAMLITISILFLLSACAPVYQTTYSYVPPKGKMAKMCTMQCQQSKMLCEQLCQSRKDNCRSNARQDAMFRYEDYKSQQIAQNQPVTETLDDFYTGSWDCDNIGCSCNNDFNTCYTSCGGQVVPHTLCVAFCDKAPNSQSAVTPTTYDWNKI